MTTITKFHLKSASLRGLKTAWLDNEHDGEGVLFFLHGYMDTPHTWRAQMEAFAEKYRVIMPFGRGIGGSEPASDKRRYGAYSILLDHLEILRLADGQGRRPIHIVGHDVGGVHAWMLACHRNHRIKTVTILNSAHPKQYLRRILWPRQLFKSWYVGLIQVPYLSEAAIWVFHKQILDVLSAEGWKPPEGELRFSDFEGACVNAMNQYRQFVRDIPYFLREKTGPTDIPVMVLSSEEDRYLETPSAPEFQDIATNVTIRVVKGKHWIHREQPERINRLLADFWSRHP